MGIGDLLDHEFGGPHTEIKLSVLQGYLRAFTTALRGKWPELWYIDAFAGTGVRTTRVQGRQETLFEPAEPERVERHQGSALIALEIEPPFDRLVFMDKHPKHCAALRALAARYPDRQIDVVQGDANLLIQREINWEGWRRVRAVMFLDPFGMTVAWDTLKAIAATRAIDVWYLFSLEGLFRQAARRIENVDPLKRAALTRALGDNEWEQELYSSPTPMDDLFPLLEDPDTRQRNADVRGLEAYVKRKLETIFPTVLEPLPLPSKGVQRFSLFFAISNPEPKAVALAKKLANHMLAIGKRSHVRP